MCHVCVCPTGPRPGCVVTVCVYVLQGHVYNSTSRIRNRKEKKSWLGFAQVSLETALHLDFHLGHLAERFHPKATVFPHSRLIMVFGFDVTRTVS